MSTHYTTEPPPTAAVLLHTTAGPLTLSLFAQQTPLTCRNFLQHCLDGTYDNTLFHRVVPGFVIQTGDPTGSGEGGHNVYEDHEFERYDSEWARQLGREVGEKIEFKDEVHSRLHFNRRGLVGMAKSDGGYGSQFFVTLGDVRGQLDGKCTMFGRVEGEGIYNVVKIAEGELLEGSERPMYPEKITKVEVLEMPKGAGWATMRKRERVAQRTVDEPVKKKTAKKKAGKALLSFGDDGDLDGDAAVPVRSKKAKFNPNLIDSSNVPEDVPERNGVPKESKKKPTAASLSKARSPSPPPTVPQKRKVGLSPSRTPSPTHTRKPSFPSPTRQLPLRNEESPSRSPSPSLSDRPPALQPRRPDATALKAEADALKASMRRGTAASSATGPSKKLSALEAMIPETSTRGRKRPRPGQSNAKDDANALRMLNAFRARLEKSDDTALGRANGQASTDEKGHGSTEAPGDGDADVDADAYEDATRPKTKTQPDADDEEANLCDLHFIANCQSCQRWDEEGGENKAAEDDEDDRGGTWMSHSLSFAKDRLGKDLTWKKKNEEELVVIDPREREREIKEGKRKERDKGKGKAREWDRHGDRDRDGRDKGKSKW